MFITAKHKSIVTPLVILVLTLIAWKNRFVLDDAFISFRYAENLVLGKGLVFNDFYRVEGYTNFLWTLLMAIPFLLNIDVVIFSQILGLLCFIITLTLTYQLGKSVFKSKIYSLETIILLGTNYTFLSYATGGLETQLQTSILVAMVYLLYQVVKENNYSLRIMFFLSLLFIFALLTRLDSLLSLLLFPLFFFWLFKQELPLKKKVLLLSSFCLIPFSLSLGWMLWKLTYYGQLLPNSYYLRTPSLKSVIGGLFYCYKFFISYWLILFPILGIIFFKTIVNKEKKLIGIVGPFIMGWFFYMIAIGGDFMEFRFFVPILPFMFLLIVQILATFNKKFRFVLISLIMVGSVYHTFFFKSSNGIESILSLNDHVEHHWERIGKTLNQAFNKPSIKITIATTAAGAIPYYSKLRTIDMHGLNDRWVTGYGIFDKQSRIGHQRFAQFTYLVVQKVNFIIGHPRVTPLDINYRMFSIGQLLWHFFIIDAGMENRISSLQILEIPLDNKVKLNVLYLTQTSAIDRIIQENNWITYRIRNKNG